MLSKRILAVHYPGCIPTEILPAIRLLKSNYSIISASPDGHSCPAFADLGVSTSLRFADVLNEDFAAVLVPGGDPGSLLMNNEIDRVLQHSVQAGAILAAVCAGPFLLAKAGLLKNKSISHGYRPEQISWMRNQGFFLDCQMNSDELTVDGKIVTATPSGAEELAIAIGNLLAHF